MIDDIKEAVQSYHDANKAVLSERDLLGINKINFELDLLKNHSTKKRTLKKTSSAEPLRSP